MKKSDAPSRCSDGMVPKQIKIGDLHLYVKGLLNLEKDDRVVETKLRFCLKRKCVTNINSSYNNIRPLNLDCAVKKDPFLGKLSKEEVANVANSSHYEAWSYKKGRTKKITGYRKSV